MTRGRFDLREHTADVAVEARGETPGAVFAAVAEGMAAAMCDLDSVPDTGDRFDVTASAPNPERLLYDYLDTLIYERDVCSVLPVDNHATVSVDDESDGTDENTWTLSGSARGVPLADVAARDLKAVTYSEMVVEERDPDTDPSVESGRTVWYAYVVFDV
ncbi:archease [Halocalculus aciditolerans]|uniref:Archease domain-containing protein n=1 Tax=Halocalculus aciditolerans TaxID=1383812 RepID=A0A830FJQ2_9EURY|nr:archease [Halocalculus aciditolerans]GGL53509.1 hypothetical protein GCM10009039_09630 [Halocalculus aciditolerans]